MKITTLAFWLFMVVATITNAQNLHNSPNAASIEEEAFSTTGWNGNAIIEADSSTSYHGDYSLRFVVNGSGREARYTFTAVPGEVYNISIWARRTANSQSPAFANWTGFTGASTQVINNLNWTEYTFTVTANITNPIIRVFAGPIGAATGREVFIDAVSIMPQTPADNDPPTPPSSLTSSEVTSDSFILTWNASSDNIGVSSYIVSQDSNTINNVNAPDTSLLITGLTENTTYLYTVTAQDEAGNFSLPSEELTVTTLEILPDTIPPSIPSGLVANNITQSSLTLSWSPSSDDTGVTGYYVYVDSVLTDSVAGNLTTINITSLLDSTTYVFAVSARDAAQNVSELSDTLEVTTLEIVVDNVPPTSPGGLIASDITTTSFTISWDASSDNIAVTGYYYYLDSVLRDSTASDVMTATLSGLASDSSYTAGVRARDAAGNVSDLSQVQVRTLQSTGVIIYTSENANLPFVDWQAKNLTVSGKAGIGTPANEDYALSVNGTVRSKEIIVESGWSDFVFEDGYYLPTLEEVEAYIEANGHLKDIPSAAEVKANGIGLARMNTLLLQKIEEITLYIIEANKKIKKLEENLNLQSNAY